MDPQLNALLSAIVLVLKNSSLQFLYFFGSMVIAGLILTIISKWTQNVFNQFKFPNFGLYVFGSIGIPIHELSHALFAKLFFHDVRKIKWFDPKGKGGAYGSVTHYYNDKNLYHRIGLFFIGMGPVLLAPILLFAMYKGLVPGSTLLDFSALRPLKSLENFGASLIHVRNWSSIGFYVFLYLTVCITSQMELSPADYEVARGGILPFIFLFLVANTVAFFANYNLHGKLQHFFHSTFVFWIGFFVLAIIVATINLLLCYLVMSLFNKLTGAEQINPFR